jgi:hypothetical protein
MKKPLFIFLSFISFFYLSCQKEQSENILTINKPLIINTQTQFDIRATDVVTTKSLMIRKIEFIDRNNNQIVDSFLISMEEMDTSENILLTLRRKSFKGTFKIISDNQILYNLNIENGMKQGIDIYKTSIDSIKSNLVPTCKFNLIHGCVSHAIKSMGIFEYGVCLYSAPECYGLLWAGCAFNYCVTGQQK